MTSWSRGGGGSCLRSWGRWNKFSLGAVRKRRGAGDSTRGRWMTCSIVVLRFVWENKRELRLIPSLRNQRYGV